MEEQLIITIGREYGSGGHEIAERLAEKFQLPLYDKEKIESLVAEESGYDLELVKKMDERPISRLFSRRFDEYSTSIPEHVARRTFEVLKQMAGRGESFVVVGRCAEYVLRENPTAVHFFINGEYQWKISRLMESQGYGSKQEAAAAMKLQNAMRKSYHNYYCDTKWGDSRGYNLVINSSVLGIDASVEVLIKFIELFLEKKANC